MPSISETYLESRQRVQPNHANNYGTVHGGNVMKWMDEYGAMAAMRFAGESCVTATVEDLDFERPVPVGDTVVVQAYAFDAGRTSVKVRVKAFREEPTTGDREQTSDSTFVYVAVDEAGQPIEVPDVEVATERCQQLRQEALTRIEDD